MKREDKEELTWMYLVATSLPELKRFIPRKWRKELKKHKR